MTPQEKFVLVRQELSSALVERSEEIDLALTALIAQEHCLLVGPPGTAKSLLADSLVSWVDGEKFSICLNKFSTPEEVFGPISLAGLKKDEYRRVITGKLPTADVAFIDEVFKASSAILNTMLTVLNERRYRNNGDVLHCPLLLAIAASNEWPTGQEVGALFDRFLFRKTVRPIASPRGRDRLLWDLSLLPEITRKITREELGKARIEAMGVLWSEDAVEAFSEILGAARREGIAPGDRRMRKSRFAVEAYAYLHGEKEAVPGHLEVLAHTLWADPAEQPGKLAQIIGQIANPIGMQINSLWAEADELVSSLGAETLEERIQIQRKLKQTAKTLAGIDDPRAKEAAAFAKEAVRSVTSKILDLDAEGG